MTFSRIVLSLFAADKGSTASASNASAPKPRCIRCLSRRISALSPRWCHRHGVDHAAGRRVEVEVAVVGYEYYQRIGRSLRDLIRQGEALAVSVFEREGLVRVACRRGG
ncbi:MAG: hypothetical protein ACLUEQ_04590 [Cloacibacillus evryensis]